MIVGVDFDNTIVKYDELMHAIAAEWGVIPVDAAKSKTLIRDAVRAGPDGEITWQRLQAVAYGDRIDEASPAAGVVDFFSFCKQADIPVYIISHKSAYSNLGESKVNLRDSAMRWLKRHGFVADKGHGIADSHVYFETTRALKIERIRHLHITHFIDDLVETFEDAGFPQDVEQFLYTNIPTKSLCDARIYALWRDIQDRFARETAMGRADTPTDTAELQLPVASEVLSRMLGSPLASAERIGHGKNSKVFRIRDDNGREYAAKFYFGRAGAGQTRLDAEFGAVSFMWKHGIRCIPRPVAANSDHQFALYDFVPGNVIDAAGVNPGHIEQLTEFAATLKALGARAESSSLPPASDAGLSIHALLGQIDDRLKRLTEQAHRGIHHDALVRFLDSEFRRAFGEIKRRVLLERGDYACQLDLPMVRQTLSPSDFGFHNAILKPEGTLVFLDFEYFGRDDPAKMIADFLLHPAQNLHTQIKRIFTQRMLSLFREDADLKARMEHIFPLVGLKWCMIMLNEFVPSELERREFAAHREVDADRLKLQQLEKSRVMLAGIMSNDTGSPFRDSTT